MFTGCVGKFYDVGYHTLWCEGVNILYKLGSYTSDKWVLSPGLECNFWPFRNDKVNPLFLSLFHFFLLLLLLYFLVVHFLVSLLYISLSCELFYFISFWSLSLHIHGPQVSYSGPMLDFLVPQFSSLTIFVSTYCIFSLTWSNRLATLNISGFTYWVDVYRLIMLSISTFSINLAPFCMNLAQNTTICFLSMWCNFNCLSGSVCSHSGPFVREIIPQSQTFGISISICVCVIHVV